MNPTRLTVLPLPMDRVEPDEQALAQAARRDPAAFAQLYRIYLRPVYRYTLIRVGNCAEAEDLTSQTFLAALQAIGTYRGQSRFAAWLFGIARNKCADYFRQMNITDFGPQPDSLETLLAQASSCFEPRVQGTETIAGRAAYIIDLGVMKCAGAAAAETGGRSMIWVDKETFFVLKHVQYGPTGNVPLDTTEVTDIRYNPGFDAGLFTFVPPAGATLQDFRPKPAPPADEYQQQLESLAKQEAYPVLIPDYIPVGLVPREPRVASIGGIELDYVPPEQVDKPSAAILTGLLINEQQASYDLVVKWTEGAKPARISGGQAWLRTDMPNPMGGGMDRAAYVLRDGTLVSIASFQIEPEELVKVAGSLKTVPGSHAPLPNPTPPLLAKVRASVSFPVFVPTDVPAGLTPEPPLVSSDPESSVTINYHAANGQDRRVDSVRSYPGTTPRNAAPDFHPDPHRHTSASHTTRPQRPGDS